MTRRTLALALLPALLPVLGCNTLLGLDPGKIHPMGAGGSAAATSASGTGGGTGGGPACGPDASPGCNDVVWAAVFADPATTHAAVTSLGVDTLGDVVLAGFFGPEVTFGDTLYAVGAFDYFLVKLDPVGQPLWISQFGSLANDSATFPLQVAVNGAGQIAVAGAANGMVDFGGGPLVSAPGQTDFDVVVARFDEQGHHVWSKRFGSVGQAQVATQVAFDPAGDVVLGGWFQGTLDLGGGALPTQGNTQNGFVAKLDGTTGDHRWSLGLVSAQSADLGSLAVDEQGNVAVAGNLDGYLDLGGGTTLTGYGLYVAGLDAGGTTQWAKAITSSGNAYGGGARFDRLGNALVTGAFGGTIQFGALPQVSDVGGDQQFLAKLDPVGNAQWAMPVPTDRVAVDEATNVVVAGSFSGTVNVAGQPLTSAGGQDMVVAKLDPTGALLWSKTFGDAANQYGTAVAVAPGTNRVVFAGSGSGKVDFGTGPLPSRGSADVFVAVFEP